MGGEGEHLEPTGRKVFTLTFLAVLIGVGTVAPVNYDGHTPDETSRREYDIAAEILMPADHIYRDDLQSLNAVTSVADLWKVTPSAVVMRGRRLGKIERDLSHAYLDALKAEYDNRAPLRLQRPPAVNALRRHNGLECSRRILTLLDAGHINAKDASAA